MFHKRQHRALSALNLASGTSSARVTCSRPCLRCRVWVPVVLKSVCPTQTHVSLRKENDPCSFGRTSLVSRILKIRYTCSSPRSNDRVNTNGNPLKGWPTLSSLFCNLVRPPHGRSKLRLGLSTPTSAVKTSRVPTVNSYDISKKITMYCLTVFKS